MVRKHQVFTEELFDLLLCRASPATKQWILSTSSLYMCPRYCSVIRTHEGWLYLAVVLDLHSRAVMGWSMDARMHASLVLDALTMAVWRRRPKESVIIHSDQGS